LLVCLLVCLFVVMFVYTVTATVLHQLHSAQTTELELDPNRLYSFLVMIRIWIQM